MTPPCFTVLGLAPCDLNYKEKEKDKDKEKSSAHDVCGSPTLVLLLPGLGGNALSYSMSFMDALGRAVGACAVAAVTYGFPFGPTIEEAAEVVWAALMGLWTMFPFAVYGARQVLLVGYSMGGFVAQTMAACPPALGPHVAGVVLLSSAVPSPARLPVPMAQLMHTVASRPSTNTRSTSTPLVTPTSSSQEREHRQAQAARVRLASLFPTSWLDTMTGPTLVALTHMLEAAHITSGARAQEFSAIVTFFFTDAEARLQCLLRQGVPVLALHGTQDRVLDVAALRRVSGRMPPDIRHLLHIVEAPSAGHGLLFQDAVFIVDAIRQWCASQVQTSCRLRKQQEHQRDPYPFLSTDQCSSPAKIPSEPVLVPGLLLLSHL